jgi:hypothetical protein
VLTIRHTSVGSDGTETSRLDPASLKAKQHDFEGLKGIHILLGILGPVPWHETILLGVPRAEIRLHPPNK